MIVIESKRKKPSTILKKYPDAILADVTIGTKDGMEKLSPFYLQGGIPVPFIYWGHVYPAFSEEFHTLIEFFSPLLLCTIKKYSYLCSIHLSFWANFSHK